MRNKFRISQYLCFVKLAFIARNETKLYEVGLFKKIVSLKLSSFKLEASF